MRTEFLEILACPKCLKGLELKNELMQKQGIVRGELYCERCNLNFLIRDGVVLFGINTIDEAERKQEINGENKWIFDVNKIKDHVSFAIESAPSGEDMIRKIIRRLGVKHKQQRLRVLDLGAGWGGFQSWQFVKYGFEAVALELVPEFSFASDVVTEDAFFERVISDSTVLPFRNNSFDVVFSKELVHHINSPVSLFREMLRVSSPNAQIVIKEPCISIFKKNKEPAIGLAEEVGITHHFYTYGEQLSFMREVASKIEVYGKARRINPKKYPFISKLQGVTMALSNNLEFLNKFILRLYLKFIGGNVVLIGNSRLENSKGNSSRNIIPFDDETLQLNTREIKFYREELIPTVFKVFVQTREEYETKQS